MDTYLFILAAIGVVSIAHSIYRRLFTLLVFNLIIVVTYCFKPILSCMGYYVGYNGCENGNSFANVIIMLLIIPFFLGQFFTLSSKKMDVTVVRSISIFR
jgi:hypothetical protein